MMSGRRATNRPVSTASRRNLRPPTPRTNGPPRRTGRESTGPSHGPADPRRQTVPGVISSAARLAASSCAPTSPCAGSRKTAWSVVRLASRTGSRRATARGRPRATARQARPPRLRHRDAPRPRESSPLPGAGADHRETPRPERLKPAQDSGRTSRRSVPRVDGRHQVGRLLECACGHRVMDGFSSSRAPGATRRLEGEALGSGPDRGAGARRARAARTVMKAIPVALVVELHEEQVAPGEGVQHRA